MTNQERIVIFIDGSNFYHSVKDTFSLHDNEIDFSKLIEILRKERLLIGTYYYNAPLDRGYNEDVYWKQQRFFSELRKIPDFHVILANMRKTHRPDGTIEFSVKGDDIYIATDMLSFAYENKYDTAILVSGDGDFVPAIRKVQKLGKKVENAYFLVSRSNFLRKVCSSSVLMDEVVMKCIKERK
ncbi:MAG: NYN domain-containing protein [Candidatus Aenigmarchaeota archaeon]|nr:NYN domain-containing protein [Candidatus Aenigmarchaeota archaeon]